MIGRLDFSFLEPTLLLSILIRSVSVSLSYFILSVPIRECLEKQLCMRSACPIDILNGTNGTECERDVVHRMNEGYRAWEALKSVLSNRGLGIKAKKCLYEGVIVPTSLYGAEAWGMRTAERRKVNVLEMKCLRSLIGVSRMDRVRNEDMRRRAGIERELAS